MERDYNSQIELTDDLKVELNWWVQTINLNKVKTLIPDPLQLIIASDASLKAEMITVRNKKQSVWTLLKKKEHINDLEMTAAKYAILTFTQRNLLAKPIHV